MNGAALVSLYASLSGVRRSLYALEQARKETAGADRDFIDDIIFLLSEARAKHEEKVGSP